MSKSHKGKNISEETKNKIRENSYNKKKKVYCLETDTVYNSLAEVSKIFKIDKTYISKVCKGKYKSAKGYHFKFVD